MSAVYRELELKHVAARIRRDAQRLRRQAASEDDDATKVLLFRQAELSEDLSSYLTANVELAFG